MVSVSLTWFSVCWVLINSNMCNVHLDANTGRSRSMMRQQESESFSVSQENISNQDVP